MVDEKHNATAKTRDSSARDVTSLMLFDTNPTMVGIKAKIEDPADQRAI